MRTTRVILMLGLALAGGCAASVTHATVDDNRLASLPPEALTPVMASDKRIADARGELAFAERAQGEAQEFLEVTETQLGAARSARVDDQIGPSPQLAAAQAKQAYASRLVALRAAEMREKRALVERAEVDREWQKYRALAAIGRADGLNAAAFADARVIARRRVDDARIKVARENSAVNGLRAEWDFRRLHTYTAARAPMVPATGANEGPAPSSTPEPTPNAAP